MAQDIWLRVRRQRPGSSPRRADERPKVEIGSPPQTVALALHTGSSEFWVNPDCRSAYDHSACREYGHYDANLSTTSQVLDGHNFTWEGGEFEAGQGLRYQDDVRIPGTAQRLTQGPILAGSPGATVPQMQFGVADNSSFVSAGVLGLGIADHTRASSYTILDELYGLGYVSSRQFSIVLRSHRESQGRGTAGSGKRIRLTRGYRRITVRRVRHQEIHRML